MKTGCEVSVERGRLIPCGFPNYLSGIGDSDDLPEDIDESDDYIEIPHKNRLDLGKSLVFQFVSEHLPGDLDQVERIFRKRGAYSRFKDLLERKNLLEQWYNYETDETSKALRAWCQKNKIEIIG